jgi:hypothetical protein
MVIELFSNKNTINECKFFKDSEQLIFEFKQKITYSLKPPYIY